MKSKYGFETTEERSRIMGRIRSTDTKPEVALRKKLWSKGYRYRKNYKGLPGTPDIVFLKEKVAVFVDGEFWHGYGWEERKKKIRANKNYWLNKIEKNIKKDKEVNKELRSKGWIVLRFWGREIGKDLDKCVQEVEKVLEGRKGGANERKRPK